MGGNFRTLLTFGRKSQGMPPALSLITLVPVSPGVGIIPIGRFKAGSWCWLSLSCSLRGDSGHMTKGRSNNILLGPEGDLPHCQAAPLERCCSSGVDWHPFPTTWRFFLRCFWVSFLRKKKSWSLRNPITSISILLRPIHVSLVPWASGTGHLRAVPTYHMVSPGGACAEFRISNVVDTGIPDFILGSPPNANSFEEILYLLILFLSRFLPVVLKPKYLKEKCFFIHLPRSHCPHFHYSLFCLGLVYLRCLFTLL